LKLPFKTERLTIREFTQGDAAFIVALLNDADFLRYIGDRGVRTLEDAAGYLENGPVKSYAENGYGAYCVELAGTPIGLCGLLKRPWLEDVDLGFAFMPEYRAAGYAKEAAAACIAYARDELRLPRLVAIVNLENERSAGLLKKLGFTLDCLVQPPSEGASQLQLFVLPLHVTTENKS
jgi:RimJ/RimL family protein N-acetyltransferase